MLSCMITKHAELESLAGFLPFAVKVITLSGAFLRRMYDAPRKRTTYLNIDAEIKADFAWWKNFLVSWNCIRLLRRLASRSLFHIYTDALGNCGLVGFILP